MDRYAPSSVRCRYRPHAGEVKKEGHRLRGYVICTSPRAGSNWLCEILSSTGVLGRPREYFNQAGRQSLSDPAYPGQPREQVARILDIGRTPNGVYGVKLFALQFQIIARDVRLTRDLPDLRFVHLVRDDLLGQAISWTRALQTDQYRSTQARGRAPVYDGQAIARQIQAVLEERRLWTGYFARTGTTPLTLVYEDIAANPQAAVDRIAGLFGLSAPLPAASTDVTLSIQRDALSEEWRRRFVAEHGDPDAFERRRVFNRIKSYLKLD